MGELLCFQADSLHGAGLFVAAALGNRHIIIETGFKCIAGHHVQSRPAGFASPLSICQYIPQCDPAVFANQVIRHLTCIQ